MARLMLFPLLSVFCLLVATSQAAPIKTPDLSACRPAFASSPSPTDNETQTLNCCLPYKDIPVVDFSFDRYPTPKTPRIRRPVHLADNDTIARLNKAYELMKNLDRDDPRSFRTQANIHCAFCNGAYGQGVATGADDIKLQVHFSWFFFPWHRMYLYFHERILASLIGDDPNNPSFALLYWNWDNMADDLQSNIMPPAFNVKDSALYDAKRNPDNRPPARVRLNVASNPNVTDEKSEIINENLNIMYQSMMTASTADMFMGGPYRLGTDFSNVSATNAPLGGTVELNVHSGVHYWTGDPDRKLRSDMGVFTTAGRDPLFYAHHSNVDRLWDVWQTLPGGRRTPPNDTDFLDAEFYFYDENSTLVRVKISDALDMAKLGVQYENSTKGDEMWQNFIPQPVTNGSAVPAARAEGVKDIGTLTNPILLGNKFTAIVKRQPATTSSTKDTADFTSTEQLQLVTGSASNATTAGGGEGEQDEVLVIQGVQLTREDYVHIKVFLNMPEANSTTRTFSAEYVGSANVVPTDPPRAIKTDVMLEIGDNLRLLGLQNEDWIVVTLVVSTDLADAGKVTISGMKTEYVQI